MKRSTQDVMYVTASDYNLARKGKKTATSRLGLRQELWPAGLVLELVSNENENARSVIQITYNIARKLGQITPTQAGTIGDYEVEDHFKDFVSVYPGSDDNTEISLVGFRLL